MTTKAAIYSAILTMLYSLVVVPTSAQRGPENGGSSRFGSPSGYSGSRGSMGTPPPGHGSRGPTGPGSYSGPSSHGHVPSTRFGPGPEPGRYSGPPAIQRSPAQSDPRNQMQRSANSDRMQQALHKRDYNTLGRQSQNVRSRTEDLQRMQPDLPVQDRLKVPLLNHMYRQGADMIDEGRNQQDDSKIKYGLQRIQEADRRFDRIEDHRGDNNGNRSHNGRGNRGRRD